MAMAKTYWMKPTKITGLMVYKNKILIDTANTSENVNNCKNEAAGYRYILKTGEATKAQYSLLISAYMAGKRIQLAARGCYDGLADVYMVRSYK